tara:strand:- start:70 stop:837 length:768 start_codon:yes stop_codon:yes gene_type:complete
MRNYLEASEQKFKSKESGVMELFSSNEDLKIGKLQINKHSDSEKLKMELESFGFYFSQHPISLVRKTLSSKLKPIKKLVTTNTDKFIPVLINHKRVIKKGSNMYVFLEVSDETGVIDVSVPNELYEEKKPLFKENTIAMIKGTISADDYRRENLEDVGIKVRAADIFPIDTARNFVTSQIKISVPISKIEALANGKFSEFEELNSPDGIDVTLEFRDYAKNLSTEIKVDSFRISLEDSTFEKLDKLFGEENYTLF